MTVASRVGYYGKIPARGDFVRAGLPRSFTDPWDAWLQATIGPKFEDPGWRFIYPAGAYGPDPVVGVALPSTDRVGRRFPLTIARIGTGNASFLDFAECVGLAAIAETWEPEELTHRLAALAP